MPRQATPARRRARAKKSEAHPAPATGSPSSTRRRPPVPRSPGTRGHDGVAPPRADGRPLRTGVNQDGDTPAVVELGLDRPPVEQPGGDTAVSQQREVGDHADEGAFSSGPPPGRPEAPQVSDEAGEALLGVLQIGHEPHHLLSAKDGRARRDHRDRPAEGVEEVLAFHARTLANLCSPRPELRSCSPWGLGGCLGDRE